MKKLIILLAALVMFCVAKADAGLLTAMASYGMCQTGCNALWVACVASVGGVAGVSTGGAAVPAAILACNAAQGVCMAACAVSILAVPTP